MRQGLSGLLVTFALAAAFGALFARAEQADQANFLAETIRGDVAEVKLGQLATERAQSLQVREYAEMLRKDHTKSLEKASSLASEIGIPASSELTAQQQKQFESLQKLSGDEFDTTFLSQMVRNHQSDIAKFSAQAEDGSDPEVMAFAKESLPTLQAHLEHAQSIQSSLKSAAQSPTHGGARYGDPSPSRPEPAEGQGPDGRAGSPRDSGAGEER
jgi:putative membrane protein